MINKTIQINNKLKNYLNKELNKIVTRYNSLIKSNKNLNAEYKLLEKKLEEYKIYILALKFNQKILKIKEIKIFLYYQIILMIIRKNLKLF